MNNDWTSADLQILNETRFGFLGSYRVAGMGEPWSFKLERTFQLLKEMKIGAVLTLTEDDLYAQEYSKTGFVHLHEPIEDCEPPTVAGMNRAIKFINSSLKKDLGVAVHCFEGRGRTGLVLGAWLGLHESLTPQEVLTKIYKLRVHSVITPSQRLFLARYLSLYQVNLQS